MYSTLEKDLKQVNGIMSIVPKELPNWYGIKEIGFICHNDWSDAEIEYKGKRINSTIVEDTMWERFKEEMEEKGLNEREMENKFEQYMQENSCEVYELCQLAMEED